MRDWWSNLIILTKFAGSITVLLLAFALVWFVLSRPETPPIIHLLSVLTLAVAAVILGASASLGICKGIDPEAQPAHLAIIFQDSLKRFAWVVGPIAVGYGTQQVVAEIARAISGAS